jgi:ketosteroid isomerase-like protein
MRYPKNISGGRILRLNFDTAKAIVEAGHAAWNTRNLEGVLDNYTDDLLYTSNAGGPDGQPLQAFGKSGLRAMLAPVLPAFETMTSIEDFKFDEDVARVRVISYAFHIATGLELSGTYRQIMHFRGFKICRLEEFHDAAKLNAFWRLLAAESAKPVPWRTD